MCAYTVFTVGLCSLDLPKPISNTVTTVNMMLSLVSGTSTKWGRKGMYNLLS